MRDLLPKIQDILRDILDDDSLVITRASNASNVEGWDSLAHVNLITAIESKYKVKFALGEHQELKNVGDLVDMLAKKLEQKSQ